MGSSSWLKLKTLPASRMTNDMRDRVIELCTEAFEEDYRPFIDSFDEATHVLGFVDGYLVTHALWITRWLQVDKGRLLRTAYVEGVATQREYRRRGFARAVMEEVVAQTVGHDLAALSPFDPAYYAGLGWELWRGLLFVRREHSIERSPDDEQVMIFRLPKTPDLDLALPISIEWRDGDPW